MIKVTKNPEGKLNTNATFLAQFRVYALPYPWVAKRGRLSQAPAVILCAPLPPLLFHVANQLDIKMLFCFDSRTNPFVRFVVSNVRLHPVCA